MQNMVFNPATGLRDASQFPTVPADEAALRNQVQTPSDQIRDFINNTLIPGTPEKTTAAVTYYVDVVNGNDANDGLAAGAGRALKTIMAAVNKLPQIINHTVTVNIAAGTYAETVTISGFSGKGKIDMMGGGRTTCLPNNFVISNCTIPVKLYELGPSSTVVIGISIQSCSFVHILQCSITSAAAGLHGILVENSKCQVASSTISNRNIAIYASDSRVHSNNNLGTGSTYGLYAGEAATIGKYGTQPAGTTAESTIGGGLIR